jgi:hypothetical protein
VQEIPELMDAVGMDLGSSFGVALSGGAGGEIVHG